MNTRVSRASSANTRVAKNTGGNSLPPSSKVARGMDAQRAEEGAARREGRNVERVTHGVE